ncbi:thiamine-repressible mitochondrial transport protein THI74 [Abeliophyllum distichum]|uniref:Thiamine-repressible mitochondrial transport protein THI74 n=1 Tax=Abeliophyllum distichum TaxID=126358 RepID=A0ABD1TYU5_9LAMI
MDLGNAEAGQPFLFKDLEDGFRMLEDTNGVKSLEVIKCSFYLVPIWFVTKVIKNFAQTREISSLVRAIERDFFPRLLAQTANWQQERDITYGYDCLGRYGGVRCGGGGVGWGGGGKMIF